MTMTGLGQANGLQCDGKELRLDLMPQCRHLLKCGRDSFSIVVCEGASLKRTCYRW